MAFTLPNGLVICNCTPHPLTMAYEQQVFEIPVDAFINAKIDNRLIEKHKTYNLVNMIFLPIQEGWDIIKCLNKKYPGALLLGSIIAAKAYPGKIVSPVRLNSARYDKGNIIISSNRFTTFKEIQNGN